ncbi:MAG: hypothetical protein NTX34_07365 [Cytophagales bacterium]|nr:hypothetical protein [Cytophagales bacterium]
MKKAVNPILKLRMFLFIVFPLFLFSCNNNDKEIESKLVGTWQDVDEDNLNLILSEITFNNDKTYFIDYPGYTQRSGRFYVEDNTIYLMKNLNGNEEIYGEDQIINISNDSLIVDIGSSVSNYFKIKK